MLENLRLHRGTERSIVLQTRRGREIKNVIDVDPEYHHLEKYRLVFQKHPRWEERKPPVGGYNCVGHVWASRRTGVFDDLEDQLNIIFEDDGYRVVDPAREKLQPGDLVTYWLPAHPRPTFLWPTAKVLQHNTGSINLGAGRDHRSCFLVFLRSDHRVLVCWSLYAL